MNPCPFTCDMRNATCHLNCEKFRAWMRGREDEMEWAAMHAWVS